MNKPEHVSVVLLRVIDQMIGLYGTNERAGEEIGNDDDAGLRVAGKNQSETFQQGSIENEIPA